MMRNSDLAVKVLRLCDGAMHSSMTVYDIHKAYSRFTGSREFYRILIRILDANIERLAEATDRIERRRFSPQDAKLIDEAMTDSKTVTWEALEYIMNHCQRSFGVDWWENPELSP